jgi:hypothetical protein
MSTAEFEEDAEKTRTSASSAVSAVPRPIPLFDLNSLRKRTGEIDYPHRHHHLPSSLGCLSLIAEIYETLDLTRDVFILSQGHACAAHYAVLEACGQS